ncbi:MAG: hypothetical protein KatS3mg010_1148 [Acidimicrobiia bacterium]|nr:MAG: hypothetical protein KatS3mg010_1148 [Acidimicrobiia bacterium]
MPQDLGGLGAGLAETAAAQRQLARGCASTALAVNMHLFQVGAAADGHRAGKPVAPMLKRVADEGIVLASTGAEAIVAGAVHDADDGQARRRRPLRALGPQVLLLPGARHGRRAR